jgi:lia operon protein LiaG
MTGRRLAAHLGLAVAPLLLMAPSLAAQSNDYTLRGERVAVYNVAGDLRVEPGTGRDVEIRVSLRGRDASRLRVETGTVRGLPTLRVIYPDDDIIYDGGESGSSRRSSMETRIRDDGTWGNNNGRDGWLRDGRRIRVRSSGRGVEAWADIVVRVPEGQSADSYLLVGSLSANGVRGNLRLDAGAARVTADRVTGVLHVDAGSGSVLLRDIRGSQLVVDVGSGSITAEDLRVDRCTFDTGSGRVSGSNVACEVMNADTGSGTVRFAALSSNDITVDTGSGGVSLDLTRAARNLRVESGSGGVTLIMPDGANATVDIETGSGGITTDFPIRTNRVERRALHGSIGDGSGRIMIDTGSGSIRLQRRS